MTDPANYNPVTWAELIGEPYTSPEFAPGYQSYLATRDPRPCDDCPLYAHCAAHKLACRKFVAWASILSSWKTDPQLPSHKAYDKLYHGREQVCSTTPYSAISSST